MYLSHLAASLPLALSALAIPLDPSIEKRADLPAGFDLCLEAENCEVFETEDGGFSFRFVSGREPGTDWYDEHVNSTSEVGPQQEARHLVDRSDTQKRQAPCDSSNGETCSYIWVRPDRTLYGTILPRTAADSLWDNCYDFGCAVGDISLDTRVGSNNGIAAMDRNLIVKPSGTFDPAFRWPLIFAITDVVGEMTESYEVSGRVQRHGTSWRATMHTAPYRIHVARFHNQAMQGDLEVFMELESSDGWGCSQITGALSTLTGYLNPMLGHALGQIGGTCG